MDREDIFMWRRIDERLTSSGQPREAQLAGIRDLGVSHIVNLGLHSHEKALPDEGSSVAALGMTYVHIPVLWDDPTGADFDRFRVTTNALAGETIHVHCIANLRVSAFLYRYRRDQAAIGEAKARAELDRVWRPGGIWAGFVGDDEARPREHLYAGRDY